MKTVTSLTGNTLTISGRIDDYTRLELFATKVGPGEVVIDTGEVTFINSVGMREWIRLIRALRESGHTVRLDRVADMLMTQMNMIAELRGAVTISSFHAQYACPACGAEAAPLVDARLAPVPCPECGKPMELADFPERYVTIFKA